MIHNCSNVEIDSTCPFSFLEKGYIITKLNGKAVIDVDDFDKLAGKVTVEYQRADATVQDTSLLENETCLSILCSCFRKAERAMEVQRLDFSPGVLDDVTTMMEDSFSENGDAGMTPPIFAESVYKSTPGVGVHSPQL